MLTRGIAQLCITYILSKIKSEKEGSYYIDQTKNIEDRMNRHNSGHSKATKIKRPWSLFIAKNLKPEAKQADTSKDLNEKKAENILIN